MYPRNSEQSVADRPRDAEAIKQEIKDILFAITQGGGNFYLIVYRPGRPADRLKINVDPKAQLFFAHDAAGDSYSSGQVTNLARAITGGTPHSEIEFESPNEVDPLLKQRLQELDLAYLQAHGFTDELSTFNATHSIRTEPEGEFEPEKFLATTYPEFRSHGAKQEYFWTKFGEQMNIINDIIIDLEASDPNLSGQQLMESIITPERGARLSREQRYRLKVNILRLTAARRKMDELFAENLSGQAIAAKLRYIPRQSLRGRIEVKRFSFFIQCFVESDDDYNYLYHKKLIAGDDQDQDKKKDTVQDSGGFKAEWQQVPISFVRGTYKGHVKEDEEVIKTEQHEKRHAKNEFLLPDEAGNYELERAKDEILAFLRDGSSLEEIKESLTRKRTWDGKIGLYTYGLEGDDWERHKKSVSNLLRPLATLSKVNLDVLAMTKLHFWPRAVGQMHRFTANRSDENTIDIKGGIGLQREAEIEKIANKLAAGKYSLLEAKQEFDQLPKREDTGWDEDHMDFSLHFKIIQDYLNSEKNLGIINLRRPNEELVKELEIISEYIEFEQAFAENAEKNDPGPELYGQYLEKLFRPLFDSTNEQAWQIGERLARNGESAVEVKFAGKTQRLANWNEKIDFARGLI